MSHRLAALALALGCLGAAPVLVTVDDGTIDWTAREVRVNGVGTPEILSHTGGVTPRDPYTSAREDARRRLERVLGALAVDGRGAADVPDLDAMRASALRAFRSAAPIHFSDGTVHLPAVASFAWGAALAGPPRARGAHAPTGLLLRPNAKVAPRLRLTLMAEDQEIQAGLPGDAVGAEGIIWVRSAADAGRHLGPRPLRYPVTLGPRAGALVLPPASAALLGRGLPGHVVVVLP